MHVTRWYKRSTNIGLQIQLFLRKVYSYSLHIDPKGTSPAYDLTRRWWRRQWHWHRRWRHSTTLLGWWRRHPHMLTCHTGRRWRWPYHANRRGHHVWLWWSHWKPVLELHGWWHRLGRCRPSRLPMHLHWRWELPNRHWWGPYLWNLPPNWTIAKRSWYRWSTIWKTLSRRATCKHRVWSILLRSWVVCSQQSLCQQ
jgi:hypothetical protein